MLDFYGTLEKEVERLPTKEHLLGKGLMQPFTNTNSGSRKIMFGVQLEHVVPLLKPEIPHVQTGYENRFGDRSSSIIIADDDYEVLDKIPKFEHNPNHHYYLIIRNMRTGMLDVVERISYIHTTELYGYLYNNEQLDSLCVGYTIPKGEVLRKSYAFDENMNRCDGVNLYTTYVSTTKNQEDGIIISESAAKKLASPIIKEVSVPVNDNDILLNLYGDIDHYKSFADIGETVNSNILCAVRREKTEEYLFSQSQERLRNIFMSDEKYIANGEVIDIKVHCNAPDILRERSVHSQILYYYNQRMRFNDELVNSINSFRDEDGNIKASYKLTKLYNHCSRELQGELFTRDNPDKPFGGTLIEFTVLEKSIPNSGDKITNRFGGKGVISKVVKDEEMPITEDGKRIEMVFNGSTCVNRLNPGQLMEISLNFISEKLLKYFNETKDVDVIGELYDYMSFISKDQANDFMELMYDESTTEVDREIYINSILDDSYLILANRPMSESMTLDILDKIYKRFPFIKQSELYSQILDSNGNPRFVKGRRPITCGSMYTYRLKQYAEDKFSVTSLSSTNIRNENAKSKSNKNHRTLHANTPIRFGNMEMDELDHMGTEPVVQALMMHSVSPHARCLMEKALTGDPYHVDIHLDDKSKNLQVEILNARLKTIGLRLRFKKVPKKVERAFLYKVFEKVPKLPDVFGKISDDELEIIDIEKYAKFCSEMSSKAEERAFITDAFSNEDDE